MEAHVEMMRKDGKVDIHLSMKSKPLPNMNKAREASAKRKPMALLNVTNNSKNMVTDLC